MSYKIGEIVATGINFSIPAKVVKIAGDNRFELEFVSGKLKDTGIANIRKAPDGMKRDFDYMLNY